MLVVVWEGEKFIVSGSDPLVIAAAIMRDFSVKEMEKLVVVEIGEGKTYFSKFQDSILYPYVVED